MRRTTVVARACVRPASGIRRALGATGTVQPSLRGPFVVRASQRA